MSITAIVARKRLAILERIIVPALPRKRVMGRANQNITPAIPRLARRARAVNDMPCTLARRTDVVSTAGPALTKAEGELIADPCKDTRRSGCEGALTVFTGLS